MDPQKQPSLPMTDQWTTDRLTYLRGLKNPTDHQRLLLDLADLQSRTADQERTLTVLLKAEKAAERAQKARAEVARVMNADKVAERKARDHALYQVAGLLSLAGLVDKRTGKPLSDRGELLGALMGLEKVGVDDSRRADWKRLGDALLAETEKQHLHSPQPRRRDIAAP